MGCNNQWKTASATIERSRGFNDAIKRKGFINNNFNKVHELYCNFSGKEGYEKMKKLLETDTNFNLIYSHNDDMAIGASKAIREKGIKHKIYIIGIDAVPSEEGGILAVVNGEMDKTIMNTSIMARNCLKNLFISNTSTS